MTTNHFVPKAALWLVLTSAACGSPTDLGDSTSPLTPVIPPFPDLCSSYQIKFGDQLCEQGCLGAHPECTPQVVAEPVFCGSQRACVAFFDPTATCAARLEGAWTPSLMDCVGTCHADVADGAIQCVTLPGAFGGRFSSDGICVTESDCAAGAHCVAVRADGVRKCSSGDPDGSDDPRCNRSEHCVAGTHCALPDASFLGTCTKGDVGDLCYRTADCQAGRHCVEAKDLFASGDAPKPGRCTDGSDRAPCAADGDCAEGKCITYRCGFGNVFDDCVADADCKVGLSCVQGACSGG